MKKLSLLTAQFIVILVISGLPELKGQVFLDIESGFVFSGYSDVRIPGDQGTLFSLSKELDTSPAMFFRARIGYTINSRHNISALYAPLSLKSEGRVPRDISFEGEVFPANSFINGLYKFNSYGHTYR